MKLSIFIFFFILLGSNLFAQKSQTPFVKGKASFYSDWFDGRLTANGEYFSQEEFTAAHMTLPFGTWLEVTNLDNKKSVYLRINDRGPYVKGRVIDLSKAAAKAIGDLNQGIFNVQIRPVNGRDLMILPLEFLIKKKSVPLRQRSSYLDFSLITP
ncbi:septal ring lytic transglycosylase RlpA family protein [Ancylomarina euxinus]|uniref:Probable endolytic peptidoglycan transglycosylase RlpA n=1 Tax=Ancylomarina euxinus TaxID=2283627 RepID=A0A425Y2T0_9BACT|nr:septal ring lytic transglycosylase RlpA family protein [Ancylomarina euxinus]MCZ4693262.1 septal ring lytic transglycosylase RlpA family protein [Ancylomarina euxinus]MUP16793.1 septal ring lytic transglycosylase RlpA family protein [Ancylomarina euxinus]RRG22481.1 septal ring lytic transglycosylase RlpA family protein [Ancylomarina euxinus]